MLEWRCYCFSSRAAAFLRPGTFSSAAAAVAMRLAVVQLPRRFSLGSVQETFDL